MLQLFGPHAGALAHHPPSPARWHLHNFAREAGRDTQADGTVYHTYSAFERGLDMFLTAYHYLDIVPKGRDEDGFSHTMEWIRRHDEYDD